jgi:heptosyltransferase-2
MSIGGSFRMNVGVFLPNWIGDVVMATPTLRALKKQLGADGRLVGVMRPYVAQVLAGTSRLDAQLFYDPRSRDPQLRSRGLLQKLRDERLDAVVLLTNSLRTAVLAKLSGAARRIGYDYSLRGPLLTDRLTAPHDGRTWYGARRYTPSSALDFYLQAAYALGCPPESPQLELAVTADDEAAADRAWEALKLPSGDRVIVFNSGGAFGAAKLWPNGYFAELARRIVRNTDYHVLMLCGPAERDVAEDVVGSVNHPRVVSLADQPLGLGLSKACVRRARLMVTTDSGPRHFAAAFGVPVIGLFGPTHIAWSENHFPGAVHLQHVLPCGPCQQRVCPLGTHACMRDLTPEEVFLTVTRTLRESEKRAA